MSEMPARSSNPASQRPWSARMIARGLLVSTLLLSVLVSAAQGERSMLGYVGDSSFWIDAPTGWNPDTQAAKRFNAIFVLTPQGTNFNSAGAVIVGSSYADSSVAEAQGKVRTATLTQDPAAEISDPGPLQVGDVTVSLMEIRSRIIRSQPYEAIAYIPLGKNVVVVTLSALAEDPFQKGKVAWADMLRTYAVASIRVQQGP